MHLLSSLDIPAVALKPQIFLLLSNFTMRLQTELAVIIKQMQKRANVDNIDLPFQLSEWRSGIEDISSDEFDFESGFVWKSLYPRSKKLGT